MVHQFFHPVKWLDSVSVEVATSYSKVDAMALFVKIDIELESQAMAGNGQSGKWKLLLLEFESFYILHKLSSEKRTLLQTRNPGISLDKE